MPSLLLEVYRTFTLLRCPVAFLQPLLHQLMVMACMRREIPSGRESCKHTTAYDGSAEFNMSLQRVAETKLSAVNAPYPITLCDFDNMNFTYWAYQCHCRQRLDRVNPFISYAMSLK